MAIPVEINPASGYSDLQGEIIVPEGMTIESINLPEGMREHIIDCAKVGKNTLRFVIYSTSLAKIPVEESTTFATIVLQGCPKEGDTVFLSNTIACTIFHSRHC